MAKKLNKKVAVAGIIALAVIVVGGTAVIFRQVYQSNPDRALENARQALADGEYKRAESLFSKAFKYGKTDAFKIERLFEMAEFHLIHNDQHEANWPKALRCWNTVINIDPKNLKARQLMVQYFFDMADSGSSMAWKNVYDNTTELMSIAREKGTELETQWLEKLGRAAMSIAQLSGTVNRSDYLNEAISTFEDLIQSEPKKASHYSYLADALLLQGEINEQAGIMNAAEKARNAAKEQLDQAILTAENKSEALANRYSYDLRFITNDPNKVDSFRAELEAAVKTASPNARLFTILSQAYEMPGRMDAKAELNRAIETAQQAKLAAPDAFEHSYRLAVLMYRKGSAFGDAAAIDDALTLAEEMKSMPQTQDIPGPQQARNMAYRNALNIFLAKCYLGNALDNPDEAQTWTEKADPLVAQISQYYGSSEHMVVQQWEGILALAKGKRDIGIRLMMRSYEQAKALDSSNQLSTIDPVLCSVLARVAKEENQLGMQREFLEKALSNRTRILLDKPSLILDYAELMTMFQAWNQAIPYVTSYQQRYGDNDRTQKILTDAALILGDTEKIMQAIAALPDNSPEQKLLELKFVSSQVTLTQRQIAQLKNEQQQPSQETLKKLDNFLTRQKLLLSELIETVPDRIDVQLMRSVAVHYLQNNEKDQAIKLLDSYLTRIPQTLPLKILRLQANEPDPLTIPSERFMAIQMEAIESLTDPKQKAMAKADVLRAKGDFEKSLELLSLAAEADKANDADVVEEQFQIAIEKQDINLAEKLLGIFRSRNLDGCEGNLASSQLELLRKNYALALRRADEALAIKPLSSSAYYLKSRIYQQMENLDAAAQNIRRSVQMDPLNSLFARHLASVLFARNTALGTRITPDQRSELIQAITTAMFLNPNDLQLQSVYAEVISDQTPDRALAIRQQLLQMYPSANNAIMLGRMALRMAQAETNAPKKTGLIELSGKAFKQALQIEPQNEGAKSAYADYLHQTSQSKEAEEFLGGDKNLLWRYYLQNGQFDKAQETLIPLFQADARDVSVLRGLILTAEGLGNRPDQKKYLDLMAELSLTKDNELWTIQKYLETGYPEQAQKRLEEFKKQYPDEKLVLLLEAWAKMSQGLQEEAMILTNRYLESDSENAGAWRLRGRLFRLANEPLKAVDDLQRSKSLNPNPAVSMELATLYSEMGQMDTAIGELVNGLQNPQAPLQMRVLLETLYQRNKRTADLEQFYTQTLEKFQNAPFWTLRAGHYYLSQNDAAKAVFYLKITWEAIRRQQAMDPSALNMYLEALILNHQYNDAITVATEMMDSPLASIAYTHMAQAQFHLGQKDKAESLFSSALEKSGAVDMFQDNTLSVILKTVGQEFVARWIERNPNALPNLLLAYRLAVTNQQFNRGIELIDKCLAAVSPESPEWGNLALKKSNVLVQAYIKTADKGYMNKAIDVFRQILERYPDNPSILNNMAYLLTVNNQQLDQALQYARQAHQKEPGNPVYLDTYGYAQFKNGQTERAVQSLLRAIQLYEVGREPIPWDLYNHLGQVQEALGDAAKALDTYRKALDASSEIPENERILIEERINKLKQQANTGI